MNDIHKKQSDRSGLQNSIAATSSEPGVYFLKNADNDILYIGKARNLKKRLGSYVKNSGYDSIKTEVLVKKIVAVETIITRTEKEALLLESNLIKKHRPRYNVILKDDKRYPSLRLDRKEKYPSFTVVRKIGEDDALYFGPFASATAVRDTLKIINKTFKLRKCKAGEFKTRTRPCLHCQMDGCLAPCCRDVEPDIYREQVEEAVLFLKGRTGELVKKIRFEMDAASAAMEFEKAARLRDKMYSLQKTIEKQIAVTTDFVDRDIFAIASSGDHRIITMLSVRGGFMSGNRHFVFSETLANDAEAVGAFIHQFYEKSKFIPREILVAVDLEDAELIAGWLTGQKGTAVRIRRPQRGEKLRLVKLAAHNAEIELKNTIAALNTQQDLLKRLQRRLGLERLAHRIECYDNSNISGTDPVASMVVFENGQPRKSDYRKYRIKTVSEHDDYAYISEVLSRRFAKGVESGPFPDLVMVDGGKGQLNIALSVICDLNLQGSFAVLGIAKKDEKRGETRDKIFLPGRANPVNFGREEDLLLFLQRIRDEAHRFAITFHRKRRMKSAMQSVLDGIPGIGKKRKSLLLNHFKSIQKIRAATLDEISALPGMTMKAAEALHKALSTSKSV